jgi:hypothetical protein
METYRDRQAARRHSENHSLWRVLEDCKAVKISTVIVFTSTAPSHVYYTHERVKAKLNVTRIVHLIEQSIYAKCAILHTGLIEELLFSISSLQLYWQSTMHSYHNIPDRLIQRWLSRLVFGKCSVRISAWTQVILTEYFRCFLQSLQANVGNKLDLAMTASFQIL